MTDKIDWLIKIMFACALLVGLFIGRACKEPAQQVILRRDTVQTVKIQPREVFIKPDVRIKSILVPYRDTMYITKEIPCDSAFIAQADSVITTTGDTINVAFSHNPLSKPYFSMVVKPRPDSIIIEEVILQDIKVEKQTEWSWLVTAFAVGVAIGIIGASR